MCVGLVKRGEKVFVKISGLGDRPPPLSAQSAGVPLKPGGSAQGWGGLRLGGINWGQIRGEMPIRGRPIIRGGFW
jgi:hypothetical protein